MWFDEYYQLWRPKDNRDCAVDVIEGETIFLETVVNNLKTKRVAVQAGGHIGINPIILSKSFYRVYTIEPILENYECLEKNINSYKNISSFNVALSDKARDLQFLSLGSLNSGAWQVNTELGDIKQKAISIDSLNLRNVDFIQLDVEGYELRVLEGANKTISIWHPVIMVEDMGHGPSTRDYLSSLGYKEIARSDTDIVYSYRDNS